MPRWTVAVRQRQSERIKQWATLDEIDGSENGGWQGQGKPQQLPAWAEVS
jgi:hypothetical protein